MAEIQLEEPWLVDAACRDLHPDLFFPAKGEPTDQAKAVCAGCQVRDDCLKYAMDNNFKDGIWGGMSERQRRAYRRSYQRPVFVKPFPHGTEAGYRRHRREDSSACVACRHANAEAQRLRKMA